MPARVLSPVISLATVLAVIVAAVAVYAYMNTGVTHAAGSTFAPTTGALYCKNIGTTFSTAPAVAGTCAKGTAGGENLAPGGNPDITTNLQIPFGDLNFAAVNTMGPGTTATGLPVGALVGGLDTVSVLGIQGGTVACGTGIPVAFALYNVDLPRTSGGGLTSDRTQMANITWPKLSAATTTDRFEDWRISANGSFTAGTPTGGWAIESDEGLGTSNTGNPSAKDGTSRPIQNFPGYVLNLLDPDFVNGVDTNTSQVLIPKALYGGVSLVDSASTHVPLFFAIFDENALATQPAPLNLIQNMGEPSVSILNDPSDIAAFPSGIHAFCSSLDVRTTLLGSAVTGPATNDPSVCGTPCPRFTSPAAGTGYTAQYILSQRDLDQDDRENSLDTCPKDVNVDLVNGNTDDRGGEQDIDGDFLDNACDLTAAPFNDGADVDADAFENRLDNCPLNNNPSQAETEQSNASGAADNGPLTDGIGDLCDSGTVTGIDDNGVTNAYNITLSTTVSNGRFHTVTNVVAHCFGDDGSTEDVDLDGVCVAQDGDDNDAQVGQSYAGVLTEMDTDGDGFSDSQETYMGTDAARSCAINTVGGDETINNWALDHDNSMGIDVLDLSFYVGQVGTTNQDNLDLTQDGQININDLSFYVGKVGTICGGAGNPPVWTPQ